MSGYCSAHTGVERQQHLCCCLLKRECEPEVPQRIVLHASVQWSGKKTNTRKNRFLCVCKRLLLWQWTSLFKVTGVSHVRYSHFLTEAWRNQCLQRHLYPVSNFKIVILLSLIFLVLFIQKSSLDTEISQSNVHRCRSTLTTITTKTFCRMEVPRAFTLTARQVLLGCEEKAAASRAEPDGALWEQSVTGHRKVSVHTTAAKSASGNFSPSSL